MLGKARDAKSWEARRSEILELYRREVFGRAPGKPAKVGVEVSAEGAALGGKAARKIVTLSFGGDVKAHMLMYLPAGSRGPAPVFLGYSFGPVQMVANDPGVPLYDEWPRTGAGKRPSTEESRGRSASQWQVEKILAAGYGLAVIYYGDIEPDFDGGMKYGVRSLYPPRVPTAGRRSRRGRGDLSRAMDYLETDKGVDAKHVAVFGHSRLGQDGAVGGSPGPAVCLRDLERIGRGRGGHQRAAISASDARISIRASRTGSARTSGSTTTRKTRCRSIRIS